LLATADSSRWFPYPAIKWAWVCFDALLAAGLFALRARWRPGLARLLTLIIAADAALTALEGAWWNASRATTAVTWLLLLSAVAAPALACIVVGRASSRRATRRSVTQVQ
jgi:hypothetical protein